MYFSQSIKLNDVCSFELKHFAEFFNTIKTLKRLLFFSFFKCRSSSGDVRMATACGNLLHHN